MKFSEALLEEIYKKVRVDGVNAMDACMALGQVWGYKRSERGELFEAYFQYCLDKKVKS